jgi:hypothetical protein
MFRAAILSAKVLALALTGLSPAADAPAGLAFHAAGEGLFDFNTGPLRGRLKLDSKYQGLYPLIDAGGGADLVNPPGVFSPYRVFSGKERFGNAARDWPTAARLLPGGAVEARIAAAAEHPLEITMTYRWQAPDALDFEVTVTPQRDMPRFELFMSSYFTKGFRASVYLKDAGDGKPGFAAVDRTPQSHGAYVMYPRDDEAVRMIRDGRWTSGSNPVDWAPGARLAAPVVIRRDASQKLTAAMMCPPGDCFAIGTPWNPATPEAGGYRSLYLSLFGKDLKAGEPSVARCRLILAPDLTDEQVLRRYAQYTARGK